MGGHGHMRGRTQTRRCDALAFERGVNPTTTRSTRQRIVASKWDCCGQRRRLLLQSHQPDSHLRLRDYARAAADSAPPGSFTIVAHSAGGVIAAEVAQIIPDRVDAIVGVSAVVAAPGGSFVSAMPVPHRWALGAMLRLDGTRPPDSVIRSRLAHGLGADLAERVVSDFRGGVTVPVPGQHHRGSPRLQHRVHHHHL